MPVLVALALVLVILQPRIAKAVQRRRERNGTHAHPDGGPLLFTGLLLASVYGGYFTAAQGIIYLSLMGMLLDDTLQRLNAVKNVLAAVVNSIAALFFLFVADFDWTAVLLIAVGSAIGGQIGAKVGRRLPPDRAARADRGRSAPSPSSSCCCADARRARPLRERASRDWSLRYAAGCAASHSGSSDRSPARSPSSIASAGDGYERLLQQRHPRLLRRTVRFAVVVLGAGGDRVQPGVRTTVRPRHHMVHGRRPPAAVRAPVLVPYQHTPPRPRRLSSERHPDIPAEPDHPGHRKSTAAARTRSPGWACSTTALSCSTSTTARLSVTVDSGSKLAFSTSVSRIPPTSRVHRPSPRGRAWINSGRARRDGQRNKKCPALISSKTRAGQTSTNAQLFAGAVVLSDQLRTRQRVEPQIEAHDRGRGVRVRTELLLSTAYTVNT